LTGTDLQRPKAFIAPARDYEQTLRAGLHWLGAAEHLRQAGGIFLKPNLTYPQFRPGVTTTREVIEAAVQVLTEINPRVVIGESDGGYGSFEIEAAFQSFDLYNLGRRYGAAVVNLSREPVETCNFATRRGAIFLEMPRFILRENFVTVTLPVPKVHCMTGVSLSFKNQWGCLPDMMRLRLHYNFNEIIGPINRRLNVGLAIVDGTYGLTRNGPIAEGKAVEPGWLVMSRQAAVADRVASYLMGLRLEDYAHYRRIGETEPLPQLAEIEANQELEPFRAQTPKFYLKRHFWNYVAMTTWYSRRWSYIVYESRLTGLLHRIMYSFREKPKDFRQNW